MADDAPPTLSTQELNDLRRRIYHGEDYTYEEARQAIAAIRTDRNARGQQSAEKKKKPGGSSQGPDLTDLTGGV